MKAENDERSITWAPTKIRELEGQIERMSENFTQRLDAVEGRATSLETDEHISAREWEHMMARVVRIEKLIGDPDEEGDDEKPVSIFETLERIEDQLARTRPVQRRPSDTAIKDAIRLVNELRANVFTDTGFNRITELAKQVNALREGLDIIQFRFIEHERWCAIHRHPHDHAQPRIAPNYESEEPIPEFSEPIGGRSASIEGEMSPESINVAFGGVVPVVEDSSIPLDQMVMGDFTKHGGLFAVDDQEINRRRLDLVSIPQAEKRIRDYMTGHFSTATIEGVVKAIKGQSPG